jgi:hypothetical protein
MMILAALALLAAAPSVHAQTVDKNGRCHGPDGKFAKMEVCKGVKGAAAAAGSTTKPAAAADLNGPYKLDAKGKCHDAKGKMAAKAKCA